MLQCPYQLNDRYELTEFVSAGANGEVYVARDRRLDTSVAVKLLSPVPASAASCTAETIRHAAQFEELAAEAKRLASARHPHVLPVYDVGTGDRGECFLVMQLIGPPRTNGEAGSNAARDPSLKSRGARNGRPMYSHRDAAKMIVRICGAIEAAHDEGVFHGDLKPENVLVVPFAADDGTDLPLVADFGVSRSFGGWGTPGWMAPEFARQILEAVKSGKEPPPMTSQEARVADVYSIGSVLYFLLTGYPPYDRIDDPIEFCTVIAQDAARAQAGQPTDRREFPPVFQYFAPALAEACNGAMAWHPSARIPTAAALAVRLQEWLRAWEPQDIRTLATWYGRVPIAALLLLGVPCVCGIAMPAVAGEQSMGLAMLFMFLCMLAGATFYSVAVVKVLTRTGVSRAAAIALILTTFLVPPFVQAWMPDPMLGRVAGMAAFLFLFFGLATWARSRARATLAEAGVRAGFRAPSDAELRRVGCSGSGPPHADPSGNGPDGDV